MKNNDWPSKVLNIKNFQPQKNLSTKQNLLFELKNEILENKNLIDYSNSSNLVFSDGDENSEIMLIGEAPGEEEDKQQIPFVGKSGSMLRLFLKEAKINNFYITNIINWRPPLNRTPTTDEINKMKKFIIKHIKIIQPKIIVAVGATALKGLNIETSISQAQSNLIITDIGKIFPIYHPAYALRVSSKKKDLWQSLLKLKVLITTI